MMDRISMWARFFSRISYPRDVPLVLAAFRRRRNAPVPDEVWHRIASIGGFLSAKEAGLLYWAACAWPVAGPVVELGSYEGRSTVVFALGGRQVHAVDAWSLDVEDLSAYGQGEISAGGVLARFRDNLSTRGLMSAVSIHQGLTQLVGQSWSERAALLYVDAGHTYANVLEDLAVWTPHLHVHGLLLMHDVLGAYPGVTRAASELRGAGWRVTTSAGSIVAFVRQ